MVTLPAEGRWSIKSLGDADAPAALRFLERDALINVYLISRLLEDRSASSAQMVEVVRKNGTPVWWLLGKDEGHGFAKKKNRDYQFYATVEFVKEYLLK